MKRKFILRNEQVRDRAISAIREAPEGMEVVIKQPTRSLDANAAMWAMLHDVASQVEWHGLKLSPEDWKNMFTASLRQQRTVPNIEGTGFVVLGASTSKMTKGEFSDLLELIAAFGSERGVVWRDAA